MKFKVYETVEATINEWGRQLPIATSNQVKFHKSQTPRNTLNNWAVSLNSLTKDGKFITYEDDGQTLNEWSKLLNKIF